MKNPPKQMDVSFFQLITTDGVSVETNCVFLQCLRGIRCFEPEWTGSVIKSEEGVCKAENGVKPGTGAVKCKRTEATSQKIHQTLGRRRTASCSERLLCHSSETHHS